MILREKKYTFLTGFSIVELLWGVFLLATAILVIAAVLIGALKATRKSMAMFEATNVLIEEKCKIEYKGYSEIITNDSYQIGTYYVIYSVDNSNLYFSEATTFPAIRVVALGVYNVPEYEIDNYPKDRLAAVRTTAVLVYKP